MKEKSLAKLEKEKEKKKEEANVSRLYDGN